jgi:hypothetical protein
MTQGVDGYLSLSPSRIWSIEVMPSKNILRKHGGKAMEEKVSNTSEKRRLREGMFCVKRYVQPSISSCTRQEDSLGIS